MIVFRIVLGMYRKRSFNIEELFLSFLGIFIGIGSLSFFDYRNNCSSSNSKI